MVASNAHQDKNEITEEVDEETECWPIHPCFWDELDKIKFEYRAQPLAVYLRDKFIEPSEVNNAIRGALVKIHLKFRHFTIQRRSQDSFNASIEQIIVLWPGEARPATGYKQKNVRDGPIRMNPNISLRKPNLTEKTIKADQKNESASSSEKSKGKQKAKESEDEVEDTMKKKSA